MIAAYFFPNTTKKATIRSKKILTLKCMSCALNQIMRSWCRKVRRLI